MMNLSTLTLSFGGMRTNIAFRNCQSLQKEIFAFQPQLSVASERVFIAHQGIIVNAKLSKLTPGHVDMLTILAKNID